MLMFITSCIFSAHHIQGIRFGFLGLSGCYIAFTLLGNNVCDITFLRLEVITHRLRFILVTPIDKQRITKLIPYRVKSELGIYQATVHVHLNIFGLQLNLLVLYITFTKQISHIAGRHHNRIFRFIIDWCLQTCLFRRIGRSNRILCYRINPQGRIGNCLI